MARVEWNLGQAYTMMHAQNYRKIEILILIFNKEKSRIEIQKL